MNGSERRDSNSRPRAWHARALASLSYVRMIGRSGETLTHVVSLPGRVPHSLGYTPSKIGAPRGSRTLCPLFKRQVLSPLSLRRAGSGTGRTRTVIDLVDNQVPHLSATVPSGDLAARTGFEPAMS